MAWLKQGTVGFVDGWSITQNLRGIGQRAISVGLYHGMAWLSPHCKLLKLFRISLGSQIWKASRAIEMIFAELPLMKTGTGSWFSSFHLGVKTHDLDQASTVAMEWAMWEVSAGRCFSTSPATAQWVPPSSPGCPMTKGSWQRIILRLFQWQNFETLIFLS